MIIADITDWLVDFFIFSLSLFFTSIGIFTTMGILLLILYYYKEWKVFKTKRRTSN